MIFYYAMGGGLGHLTRARAVVQTLGIHDEVTVLTASPFAADPRVHGQLRMARVPDGIVGGSDVYREWVASQIGRQRPTTFIVDAFPGGLFGELCDWRGARSLRMWHVARRVRWDAYAPRLHGQSPRFDLTWIVEPLDAAQMPFVSRHSSRTASLTLDDPAPPAASLPSDLPNQWWLVAHAGPRHETEELIAYALETRAMERSRAGIVVATPYVLGDLPPVCRHVDVYPVSVLFRRAERIFTGGGFNSVRQLAPWRHKHRILPFPRALDDQYARVRCSS